MEIRESSHVALDRIVKEVHFKEMAFKVGPI
jgi:hypothetical protein